MWEEYITSHWLKKYLANLDLSDDLNLVIHFGLDLILLLVLSYFSFLFIKKIINPSIARFVKKSKNHFDDSLEEAGVLTQLSHLGPLLLLKILLPILFSEFKNFVSGIDLVLQILIIISISRLLAKTVDGVLLGMSKSDTYKSKAFDSYAQLVKMIIYIITALVLLSNILGEDFNTIFAGLGAMAALIMLVFRDSILGLVASVQMSSNDLIRVGDWITVGKFGADGTVEQIGLVTVKVRNFDNTIVNVPSYSIISEGVVNWKGMQETGGRRIKRALYIDVHSVKFCNAEDLEKIGTVNLVKDYLHSKQEEIESYNSANGVDKNQLVNGRNQTNLGLFREYVLSYLKQYPDINTNGFTTMVRQLPVSEKGIPLEIYCFTNTTDWVKYETIQSDVFDHLIAASKSFDLELYQFISEIKV